MCTVRITHRPAALCCRPHGEEGKGATAAGDKANCVWSWGHPAAWLWLGCLHESLHTRWSDGARVRPAERSAGRSEAIISQTLGSRVNISDQLHPTYRKFIHNQVFRLFKLFSEFQHLGVLCWHTGNTNYNILINWKFLHKIKEIVELYSGHDPCHP